MSTILTTPVPPYGDQKNTELFNWNPATQLINFKLARSQVVDGVASARCKILCCGDSTTNGTTTGSNLNSVATISYPARLVSHLKTLGLPAQQDNFLGGANNNDQRLAYTGNATDATVFAFGGDFTNCGNSLSPPAGVTCTLISAGSYDHVDVTFFDNQTSGTHIINVAVDGGSPLGTFGTGTNTGNIILQAFSLGSVGSHTAMNIGILGTNSYYLQGAAFWNSVTPSIEVYNAGVGGMSSPSFNTGTTGIGYSNGAFCYSPSLTILNIGINDINNNGPSYAPTTVANVAAFAANFKAQNCDVLCVMPTPWIGGNFAAGWPALRAGLQAMCLANNYPLFDDSNRYGNSLPGSSQSSNLHPAAWIYDDIGARLAQLLATC